MLGPAFVFTLFAFVCWTALRRPASGLIGFYGFMLLDPEWNWRWSLPTGFTYQKYIFFCLFAGFLLSGLKFQRQSNQAKVGIASLIMFLVICALSTAQSVSPSDSEFFLSVLWKHIATITLGILVIDSPAKVKALLLVAVLAQGYNSFQINLDYFQTGFSRFAYTKWGSTGADNNGYSIITIPLLGTSLALAFFELRPWRRAALFGIAVLQMHQIMLMQSRGCMLAGIGMCATLVIFMPKSTANIKAVLMACALGGALAGPSVVQEFSSSFETGEKRDSSADSRFNLWTAGWRITADYPVLGVGPNAARRLVPQPQYYPGGLSVSNKALHNLFFDVSTGTGIPGFLAYFLFFTVPLFYCYKSYSPRDLQLGGPRLAVISGTLGYLAASVFSSGLLFESCYVLIIAGYAISNIDCTQSKEHPVTQRLHAIGPYEGQAVFN
ncbi:O-antigen ligase family protein [Roseiconus lacunae]|uniref:O-antigen ligase family protein n=1 Tax=Roseiconus lacunae TaxID=2605694 RepID=UPI003089A223|nr:O-antigen ligase family protein [Stieleria sp. HD01]